MIIGLKGPARVGKDTVGRYLAAHHGFTTLAFADPVKIGLSALLGLPLSVFYGEKEKEEVIPWVGKSPRQLMQSLGTDWAHHAISPDIWVKVAQAKAQRLLENGVNIVFTDVRFPAEADMIKSAGGEIWTLMRPGHNPIPESDHVSESGQHRIPGDRGLVNFGTLEQLYEQVDETLEAAIVTELGV